MKQEEKTLTFLSAGLKYGLRFVKKLCTHVQVLGVVAMVKNKQQGCNVSYCWQQLLLSSVELYISIHMYCWEAAKKSQAAITEYCFFANQRVLFFAMLFLHYKGFALTGYLKTAKCKCL